MVMSKIKQSAHQEGAGKLGEILLEAGVINKDELNAALAISQEQSRRLGETLVEMRLISPQMLNAATAADVLIRIARAETFINGLGVRRLRVRHHEDIARIEADAEGMAVLFDPDRRNQVVKYLKELGYTYVTLDLAGDCAGTAHEAWNVEAKLHG